MPYAIKKTAMKIIDRGRLLRQINAHSKASVPSANERLRFFPTAFARDRDNMLSSTYSARITRPVDAYNAAALAASAAASGQNAPSSTAPNSDMERADNVETPYRHSIAASPATARSAHAMGKYRRASDIRSIFTRKWNPADIVRNNSNQAQAKGTPGQRKLLNQNKITNKKGAGLSPPKMLAA